MKIARIRVFAHDLKVMNGPYVFSGGSMEALTTYLVAVETDTGVTGWGETCPLGPTYQPVHAKGAAAALAELAPSLVGVTALPNVAAQVMERCLNGHSYAKAAIDIALWDVMGKVAGLPVHALLGGALVDRVPSYYAINLASADDTIAAVKAKQAEGFTRFQIKTGSGDVVQDAAVLRAAWEQMRPGDVMAADANRALTTADTLHLSRLLWDIPLALEQPCASLDEMRALKGRVHHPVFLDEMAIDVNTLISEMGGGLCDGLGMKVTRVGGISAMRAVRDMAVARRMPFSVDDSWGGDIIAAACVHIGATVPQDIYRGTWIAAPYIDHHYDPSGGVLVEDGHIAVPRGPGLGISPDESLFGDPVLEIAT